MSELPIKIEETEESTLNVCEEANCNSESALDTAKEVRFCEGEDILSRWNDGLLYLGTIVKVDEDSQTCLVRFEDNSEHWAMFKDLQKGYCQDSDIICSLCRGGDSDSPNEIVICDNCGFGFHQLCHSPEVPSELLHPDIPWLCRQCAIIITMTKKSEYAKKNSGLKSQTMKAFPYDPDSLTWDSRHKTNLQKCYCYCGGPGDWFMKMLQCIHCKQWFHEACIQQLEKPMLFGDGFYIFVCSVCNSGPEFIQRLALRWPDVAHLVMYNLTVKYNKKYYDFETSIMPFVDENWKEFQLEGNVASATKEERKTRILTALQNHRTRFKCGREIKKKTTIWGLRVRVPPPVPRIALSTRCLVSGKDHAQDKVVTDKNHNHDDKLVSGKNHSRDKLVTGKNNSHKKLVAGKNHSHDKQVAGKNSFENARVGKQQGRVKLVSGKNQSQDKRPTSAKTAPKVQRNNGSTVRARKRRCEADLLMEALPDQLPKETLAVIALSTRDVSRKNKSIMPVRSSPEKKKTKSLPTTTTASPTVCRSAPQNRQREGSTVPSNAKRDAIKSSKPRSPALEVTTKASKGNKTIASSLKNIKVERCDTSDDEDTSSHGTLDSIIPPPSNFEGHNNPFRNLDLFPLSVSLPLARPLKRKLSQDDSRLSKSGGVKQRKGRPPPLDSTNACANFLANLGRCQPGSNGLTRLLNGQLSEGSADTGSEFDSDSLTLEAVHNTHISFHDLKSSVHSYFGAANRIANGERFNVLARRVTPNGKIQHLIEWEGATA